MDDLKLKYETLTEVLGQMDAELMKIYFLTHGIDVEHIEEATTLNVTPITFGRVQIFVERTNAKKAHALLEKYERSITDPYDKGEKD